MSGRELVSYRGDTKTMTLSEDKGHGKKRKTKDNLRKMEFDRVPFRDNVSRESALQANKSTTRKKSMT